MEWLTESVPGLLALLAGLLRIDRVLVEARLRAEVRRLEAALLEAQAGQEEEPWSRR